MSLTIKQAFEALSDACANGMKNPFFVMRRLKESFADVASKVVDASGDKVTVTQTLTEGTEIGSIKVNNTTTALYAPAGSSGHAYSTTEQVVGTWIDGSDVYEITVNSPGSISTTPREVLDMSTYNVNEVVAIMPVFYENDAYASYWNAAVVRYTSSTKKLTTATNQYSVDGGVIVTIRYTKNTEE